jgi:hypothetical protein
MVEIPVGKAPGVGHENYERLDIRILIAYFLRHDLRPRIACSAYDLE